MLCDSNTGYIFSFKICSGPGQPLARTVMDLLASSYGKWHQLYMDNYNNSVELAENLLRKLEFVEQYGKIKDFQKN